MATGRFEQRVRVQIGTTIPYVLGEVGSAQVGEIGVCFRMYGDRFNPQAAAGPNHARGDLTSICHQYSTKHEPLSWTLNAVSLGRDTALVK
jgi:hypothetical protein